MIDGEHTMLGDKGVNLSGGQKIRLSVARAVYADKDIYLLDDPISALDIHVAKYVMEECILGQLKDKTRVIATHAIGFLHYFDYIYILDDGKIVEEGNFEQIEKTQIYQSIIDHVQKEETKIRKESLAQDARVSNEVKKISVEAQTPLMLRKNSSQSGPRKLSLYMDEHMSSTSREKRLTRLDSKKNKEEVEIYEQKVKWPTIENCEKESLAEKNKDDEKNRLTDSMTD